jgi:hypothetical protein
VSNDAAAIRDEAELLARSLADARAEHARGELDDGALAEIERRDGARLDLVHERLATVGHLDAPPVGPAAQQPSGPRRSRRLLVACTVALVLSAATIWSVLARPFDSSAAPLRLHGVQSVVKVLLVQAELSIATGHNAQALTAYDAVLKLEPHNPEAYIESGWLRYEAGVVSRRHGEVDLGAAMLRRSVVRYPGNAASHLYDGVVLLQHDHDAAAAKAQALRSAELPESAPEAELTAELLAHLSGR